MTIEYTKLVPSGKPRWDGCRGRKRPHSRSIYVPDSVETDALTLWDSPAGDGVRAVPILVEDEATYWRADFYDGIEWRAITTWPGSFQPMHYDCPLRAITDARKARSEVLDNAKA